MGAKIISKFNDKVHTEKLIHVDFSSIEKNITIELELKGIKSQTIIFWEIYSNGEQLDAGDLTRGQNLELVLYKAYAGSIDKPHNFEIFAKDGEGNLFDAIQLSIFEKSIIKRAYWTDKANKDIKEAGVNSTVKVQLEGYGLFGIPILLEVFQKLDTGEETLFTKTIYSDGLQNEESFFLSDRHFDGGLMMNVVNRVFPKDTAELYFTLTYKDKLFKRGEILHIRRSIIELPESQEVSLKTVVVYSEQYFTQKYEPCKYEKIFYQLGKNEEVEVFDEKKPTKKGKDGKLLNSRVEICVIAPPKKSKNIKDLKIRLEKTETEQCSLNEKNKKRTSEPNSEKKSHKGNVIDYADLKDAEIEVIIEKVDEKATIKPSFNYRYDEKSALDFLAHYFLFSTLLDSKDVFQNELKSKLIGWEAESKGLIDIHHVGLETCRYNKGVNLKIFADVAWAFHAKFDDPFIPEYYNDNKTVKFVKGLEKEIDWVKDNQIVKLFTSPTISGAIGINLVRDFILDVIKDMADRYELGFTSYYDFDEEGKKNSQQIDYAETHPEVFKALIAGIVTLEILIDVLLIILTEGAALANFVSKASKVAKVVNKGGKLVKVGKSAEEILAKHSGTFENARMAKGVKSTFDLMKGSYYKGYRFVDDKDIGVQPVLEERVKISPLIRLSGVSQKKKLGELLLDKTPVGMIINLGKSATGGTSLGISRMFLSKISYTSAGKKVNIGKQGVGWYGAATYPLRIVNKGLTLTYNLLAFATNEAIKKVFGAEAEFEKDISAHLDLDFWLKIQNASSKLDLISIAKGASSNDKSSISIAPSGAFTVRLKFSGKVSDSVIVRAMHILTIKNKEQRTAEKLSAEGKFEVEGNIFIERRYYFEANKKPHYEDSGKFLGLAGEYEYKISAPGQVGERPRVVKKKEPTHFILMEAYEIKFNSSEMTRDPSK